MSSIITKEEALKKLEADKKLLSQIIKLAKLEAFCFWLRIETPIRKLLHR